MPTVGSALLSGTGKEQDRPGKHPPGSQALVGAQRAHCKACGEWGEGKHGALGSTEQVLLFLSKGVRKGRGGEEQ